MGMLCGLGPAAFLLVGEVAAAEEGKETPPIKLELNEQSEVWGNLAGGVQTGAVYNGLTTASLTVDLQKFIGWPGATFFASGFHIHGRGPSDAIVGNQQLLSNVEATPGIKLYNLWIEQEFLSGRLHIRVGQEGANDEMMIAPSAAVFLNSSFGYPDLLTQNLPSGGANYPLATPMVRAKAKLSDQVTIVAAMFNGDPAGRGDGDPQVRDRFGTAFRMSDPPLSFLELWYSRNDHARSQSLPGIYKLGAFYHAGGFDDLLRDTRGLSLADPLSNGMAQRHRGNFAVYAIADQMLWRPAGTKDQGISAFALAMIAPDDRSKESAFVHAGLNWKAPLPGRDLDVLGIAIAYARTSNSFRQLGEDTAVQAGFANGVRDHETAIEATYIYHVTPTWSLQPDIQVVLNPGAALEDALVRPPLEHSVTVGVRTKINLN
jgi:porin